MNTLHRLFGQVFGLSCFLSVALLSASSLPVIDIWSGRAQNIAVPAGASWALVADHGRELCSGVSQGTALVHLPALHAGAQEYVNLFVDGHQQAQVRIWSPEILAGLKAKYDDQSGRLAEKLRQHGMKHHDDSKVFISTTMQRETGEAVTLIFPERREFPFTVEGLWSEISLHHTKKGGCLSVIYDKREQTVDCAGTIAYVVFEAEKTRLYLFSPDFDMQSIDNIILLKTVLEEKKP